MTLGKPEPMRRSNVVPKPQNEHVLLRWMLP
jgi:hypothetical protein